ncbi:hypothetical protein [Shewanella phage vB_SbaS_Y11]|nr:hypothetical protein [Shewanella phage vB_SbaS_Y11]
MMNKRTRLLHAILIVIDIARASYTKRKRKRKSNKL